MNVSEMVIFIYHYIHIIVVDHHRKTAQLKQWVFNDENTTLANKVATTPV